MPSARALPASRRRPRRGRLRASRTAAPPRADLDRSSRGLGRCPVTRRRGTAAARRQRKTKLAAGRLILVWISEAASLRERVSRVLSRTGPQYAWLSQTRVVSIAANRHRRFKGSNPSPSAYRAGSQRSPLCVRRPTVFVTAAPSPAKSTGVSARHCPCGSLAHNWRTATPQCVPCSDNADGNSPTRAPRLRQREGPRPRASRSRETPAAESECCEPTPCVPCSCRRWPSPGACRSVSALGPDRRRVPDGEGKAGATQSGRENAERRPNRM